MEQKRSRMKSMGAPREVVTLGGGCFWCTEAVFSKLKGVVKVEPGYSGGDLPNPNYNQVSTGSTGHAEVVQITFIPDLISLRKILEIFFATHDPTTLNRQGADIGSQYRSVVFYRNTEQKRVAEQLIEQINSDKVWSTPVVTSVEPFRAFYRAEDYHKDYFKRNPDMHYCRLVISPKLEKMKRKYQARLKDG